MTCSTRPLKSTAIVRYSPKHDTATKASIRDQKILIFFLKNSFKTMMIDYKYFHHYWVAYSLYMIDPNEGIPIKLDLASVKALKIPSLQLMVYGFSCCKYEQVANNLQEMRKDIGIEKIYDYSLGEIENNQKTLFEHDILKTSYFKLAELNINLENDVNQKSYVANARKNLAGICKAALTNVALHNTLYPEDKITVIFCVDHAISDHKFKPPSPSELLVKKSHGENEFDPESCCTASELRRAYKLWNERQLEDAFKEVLQAKSQIYFKKFKKAAKEMFLFVKVIKNEESDNYQLKKTNAPWDLPEWKEKWEERMKISERKKTNKRALWRREIPTYIQLYSGSQKKQI